MIVNVKRADEHKTAEYHKVKEGKLHHSAELCMFQTLRLLYVLYSTRVLNVRP